MKLNYFKRYLVFFVLIVISVVSFSQNVPLGIFYQAVARDNNGSEIRNKVIEVKFSIIIDNPIGPVVFQELHSKTPTTAYGVFTLVIGKGVPTGGIYGELSQINWGSAYHYLKVEADFGNGFINMGTMQFLAVPYALYAQKSLEPGPAGPKGDPGPKGTPGDPASDNQTLSFDQNNLTISNGNSVPLTSLLQTLSITNKPEGNYLVISNGNSVLLSNAEGDGDPKNEIQDLLINSDVLKITNNASATSWSLAKYLDNTDTQALTYNTTTRVLGISGSAATIDLTELKNDADASVTNEIQAISYNPENYQVSLSNGGGTATVGQIIAFRAGIASVVNLPHGELVGLLFDQVSGLFYNDGLHYNASTGGFTAPYNGIYTFNVSLNLPINCSVIIKLFADPYETIIGPTGSGGNFRGTITMKLNKGDLVSVSVLQNNGYPIPFNFAGSFSGYRVY